jgi:hypothetical protein
MLGPVLYACSTGGGASGDIPSEDVFLEVQGCLTAGSAQEAGDASIYSVRIPTDVSLLEVRLETLGGEIDLVVGTENPPADYFSFSKRGGVQKILVGPSSNEPLLARTWYVALSSPLQIEEGCPPERVPDWQLRVQRATGVEGLPLLEPVCNEEDEGCSVDPYPSRESFSIEVPEDALSLDVTLETIQGDADLFVGTDFGTGNETELSSSMNPGLGFDVVSLGADVCVQRRGQSLDLVVESWGRPSRFRLQASYMPDPVLDNDQTGP